MTQDLVIQGEQLPVAIPQEVLDEASRAAKALTGVIDSKPKKVIINDEQYLEYEDWQTVGQFYGYTVKTHNAEPVEVDGVKGAKAQADLLTLRTGMVIGGAEAYCMRDEDNWKNKPWFQLASMAQTRAGAKALRNRLAWVVVLAGYRPTPAEEMNGIEKQAQRKGHWCSTHQTVFFKKGKMQNYAHPIGDTGEWCNEGEAPEPSPQPTESTQSAAEAESKGKPVIDMQWLFESCHLLKWKDSTIISYLGNKYQIPKGDSIESMVQQLSPEDAAEFTKEIEDRLSML